MEGQSEKEVKKYVKPRAYASKSADETLQEIRSQEVASTRQCFTINFIKKRKDFCLTYKFNEAETERPNDFKGSADIAKAYDKKLVIEIGLQGSNALETAGAQTNWRRKVNKGVQIDELTTIGEVEDENPSLSAFLMNVYPLMEEALQANQTNDVFADQFNVMPDDDSTNATEISNAIRETKNLFYLPCRLKRISCVEFYPKLKGKEQPIIAESFMEKLPFDARVAFSMKSSKSFILFWNYEDIHSIDPVLILTSPLEVLCFEFNPKNPKVLVAGTINGQVLLYDLSNLVQDDLGKKPMKQKKTNEAMQFKPSLVSALQELSSHSDNPRKNIPSHRTPVMSIHWMPEGVEFDKKNLYNFPTVAPGADVTQFVSVGSDGQLLFWDKKFMDSSKKIITDYTGLVWKAGFGVQMTRPEGVSNLGCAMFQFRKKQKTPTFTGGSDQGEVFVVDWTIKPGEEGKSDNLLFYWDKERSFRPVIALDVSPFYEDIILTVHDYNFSVWKHGVEVPFFQSMLIAKSAYITCGCWSRTRPGVIFIGRSDGNLDIWDFLDQSHKCTIQYQASTMGLSSIKFHPYSNNLIAVGDEDGVLHILELSFTLSKQIGDEEQTMREFWNREIERVKYFAKRFEIRTDDFNKQMKQKEGERGGEKEERKDEKKDEESKFEKEYEEIVRQEFANMGLGVPGEEGKDKDKAPDAK